jgi:hypothetical protein
MADDCGVVVVVDDVAAIDVDAPAFLDVMVMGSNSKCPELFNVGIIFLLKLDFMRVMQAVMASSLTTRRSTSGNAMINNIIDAASNPNLSVRRRCKPFPWGRINHFVFVLFLFYNENVDQ